jgi:hypothetical protein
MVVTRIKFKNRLIRLSAGLQRNKDLTFIVHSYKSVLYEYHPILESRVVK